MLSDKRQQLLVERCEFYGYSADFSGDKVTISKPKPQKVLSKRKKKIYTFRSTTEALYWMAKNMQHTNKLCDKYKQPRVWSYADILCTFTSASAEG